MTLDDPDTTPISPLRVDKDAMNSSANGSIHATTSRSPKVKRRQKPSWSAWAFDKLIKLGVWYALLTCFLRCPASPSDLTDASPVLCARYFQARDFVVPYAQPYYDQYLAPHVQTAQPYVNQFHSHVYQPGLAVYEKYGAPRVAEVQKYGQQQWDKAVKPQLAVLQKQAEEQYQVNLAPQVKKVQDAALPYYASASSSAEQIWKKELEPRYRQAAPHAQKLLNHGQQFAVETALPQAQLAGGAAWTFWNRQIWPSLRVIYGENVEPQLMRITERLGRYKDGLKLEAEIKGMETSSSLTEASSTAVAAASSLSSGISEATVSPSSVMSAAASAATETVDPKALFKQDLQNWELVSAKAVDEGAEDLQERIRDIAAHQVKSQAEGVGEALIIQLEEAMESALASVKFRIQRIAGDIPTDADNDRLELAFEDLFYTIRNTGQNVKHRAQAVREWRHTYQAQTDDLIEKALQSTLETIDSIRELRLTEIGRKFASSSLPHKEWAKYNEIKKAKPVWRRQIEQAATAQEGIKTAKEAGLDVESRAMAVAEDAAKELARLKEVGKWKIAARDTGDDFATKVLPPAIKLAQDQAAIQIAAASEAVFGKDEELGTVESVSSVLADQASSAVSVASEAVVGSSTGTVESLTSKISAAVVGSETPYAQSVSSAVRDQASAAASYASDAASSASEAVVGSSTGSVESLSSKVSEAVLGSETPYAESLASQVSASAESAATAVSEAVIGTPSGLSDSATDVASSLSSAVLGSETPVAESVLSSVSSGVSEAASQISGSASSVASQASESVSSVVASPSKPAKKVFGGAMAQVLVEARTPILDIDEDERDSGAVIQSVIDGLASRASILTSALEDALKQATATQGSAASITSLAEEKYFSALAAARSVLVGDQNAGEIAQERYSDAVTAAYNAIFGTSTTTAFYDQVTSAASVASSAASSRYDAALSDASRVYEDAKSRISVQISGTPAPYHEQMLASVESGYSQVVAAASQRLDAVLNPQTEGPYASISAVASSRLQDALSAASAQFQSAKIAVGALPEPSQQHFLGDAQRLYYENLGAAHARYDEFLTAASTAIYGTQTGILESAASAVSTAVYGSSTGVVESAASAVSTAVYGSETPYLEEVASKAQENWDALIAKASEQVYGAPVPWHLSIPTQAVSSQWDAVTSLFSELVTGKEPDFTASVYSRLQSAYSTGALPVVASASSVASEAYASAASVVQDFFVPPTAAPGVFEQFQAQLNAAVDAASTQIYGSEKGAYEHATEAAASVYTDASSALSSAVYGSSVAPYNPSAMQSSILDLGASASSAFSSLVYGTPTPTAAAISSSAASIYSSLSAQAVSQASAVSESIANNLPEQSYLADINNQVSLAVASASSRIAGFASDASAFATGVSSSVSSIAVEASSSASSVVSSVSAAVRDEL